VTVLLALAILSALGVAASLGALVYAWVFSREIGMPDRGAGGLDPGRPWIRNPFRDFLAKLRAQRKFGKIRDLFPQALGMAVQGLKAGQTVPQVLEYLSKESPSPLREEWEQVCSEIKLGSSTQEALARLGDRYPDFQDFQPFLQSYKISRQTGANLTHLLEVLMEGMETRDRLSRRMESMTAQARLSGWVMGLLPFILLGVFFLMDPELLAPLFTQKTGWGILALAAGMEWIGYLWIRQLLRVEL